MASQLVPDSPPVHVSVREPTRGTTRALRLEGRQRALGRLLRAAAVGDGDQALLVQARVAKHRSHALEAGD